MRLVFSILVLLITLQCPANAGPKEEALQVVSAWTKAFTSSDLEGIVKLYAPDAVMIGTGSKALIDTPEGVRRYFEGVFRAGRFTVSLGDNAVLQVSDSTVVVTGFDTIAGVLNAKEVNLAGRDTFVIVKRGADWPIVHFHRSATPN